MALKAKKAKIDEILGSSLRDISAGQFRELMLIIAPVLLLVVAAVWIAFQFVQPAPPKRIVISTGGQSGGYFTIGQKYATFLKRNGITLEVRTSAGSLENVARLKDDKSDVSVALLQGGVTDAQDLPNVVSLGRLFPEPLWIFYRSTEKIEQLHQLQGKRVAVGPEGSGTRVLALKLLKASQIDAGTSTLLPLAGMEAAEALVSGAIDAAFLALAPEAPVIQKLIRTSEARLMNMQHAEAYTRLFPYLQKIVLPQGAYDLVQNIPASDVHMVAPVAALVARETLHPAIVGLLVEAAKDTHGRGGLFHRVGDFPKPLDPEFEASEDAERYYKAGPSFLKRHLPFWLATFIERMSVVALPLIGAIIPLIKLGPAIYKWRIRRRLVYWYGRLKALEASIFHDRSMENVEGYREELARIDEAVSTIPVPASFADQYYSLRAAIDLVRQRLVSQSTVAANAAMG